jgi:Flp pilus assembly protein TadB
MVDRADDRTLGELFAELSRETTELIRKEMQLATTEMTAKVRTGAAQAGMIGVGGALMYAGLLVVMAAAVLLLIALGLPPWLAALIIAAAALGIGYLLTARGRARLRTTSFVPTQTIETLKENTTWTNRTRA